MKKLIIIPARAGSKRLPNKNLNLLDGKPLIMHSVDMARKIFNDNEICVSTESLKIKKVVEDSGLSIPFIRPQELAKDTSSTEDVLIHAINWYKNIKYEPDIIVLLQPTSPFRKKKHIKDAIKKICPGVDMVVSVKNSKSNPYFNLFEENESGFLKKCKKGTSNRFQDSKKVWEYNGSIYIINVKSLIKKGMNKFTKIKAFPMNNPVLSLDIDDKLDWIIAEAIINNKLNN